MKNELVFGHEKSIERPYTKKSRQIANIEAKHPLTANGLAAVKRCWSPRSLAAETIFIDLVIFAILVVPTILILTVAKRGHQNNNWNVHCKKKGKRRLENETQHLEWFYLRSLKIRGTHAAARWRTHGSHQLLRHFSILSTPAWSIRVNLLTVRTTVGW